MNAVDMDMIRQGSQGLNYILAFDSMYYCL